MAAYTIVNDDSEREAQSMNAVVPLRGVIVDRERRRICVTIGDARQRSRCRRQRRARVAGVGVFQSTLVRESARDHRAPHRRVDVLRAQRERGRTENHHGGRQGVRRRRGRTLTSSWSSRFGSSPAHRVRVVQGRRRHMARSLRSRGQGETLRRRHCVHKRRQALRAAAPSAAALAASGLPSSRNFSATTIETRCSAIKHSM